MIRARRTRAPEGSAAPETLFRLLRKEHDSQRTLLAELVEISRKDGPAGDLLQALRDEVDANTHGEDVALYGVLNASPVARPLAREMIAAHRALRLGLREVMRRIRDGGDWRDDLLRLRRAIEAHHQVEEGLVFALAATVLSDAATERSLAHYRASKSDALATERSPCLETKTC